MSSIARWHEPAKPPLVSVDTTPHPRSHEQPLPQVDFEKCDLSTQARLGKVQHHSTSTQASGIASNIAKHGHQLTVLEHAGNPSDASQSDDRMTK